jgi:hypothetical protein
MTPARPALIRIGLIALLYHRWAHERAPRSASDKLLYGTLLLGGAMTGSQFVRLGAWPPVVPLVVAPLTGLVGFIGDQQLIAVDSSRPN